MHGRTQKAWGGERTPICWRGQPPASRLSQEHGIAAVHKAVQAELELPVLRFGPKRIAQYEYDLDWGTVWHGWA